LRFKNRNNKNNWNAGCSLKLPRAFFKHYQGAEVFRGKSVKNREVYSHEQANSEHQTLAPRGVSIADAVSTQLTALLTAFGDQIFSLPDADGGAINLIKQSSDALVTAHLKLPEEFAGIQNGYKGFEYRLDQPDVNVQVFRSGVSQIVTEDNLDQFAEITRLRFGRWKMSSLVVVPLAVKQNDGALQAIGTVSIFSQHRIYDVAAIGQLQTIANIYAAQIQTLWSQNLSIERTKIAAAISDNMQQFFSCVTEMNSLTTVSGVYDLIAKEFIQQFHFDAVSILLADEHELSVVATAFSEPYKHLSERHQQATKGTKYSFSASDGQSGYVYTQNQHFYVEDAARIVHLPMSEKDRVYVDVLETIRTLLIVPIRLHKTVIGTMTLATLSQPQPLSETDLKLIEMLAAFSSTAIRNAKTHELLAQKNNEIELLNQDLKTQMTLLDQVAHKDHLTGLNNFGSFEEELKRRTSEYARMGTDHPLAVILLDVDHFKLFNDAHGHLAGNEVLQEVAARVSSCAREMDFVARYGGEEFVMLLPQCDLASASKIAERIRCKIAEENFIVQEKSHNITVSGGCAQYFASESPHNFLYRADSALYCAKRNGRNRIQEALTPTPNIPY
jgi:diguanylate cyclase (GGDEF)-like protein